MLKKQAIIIGAGFSYPSRIPKQDQIMKEILGLDSNNLKFVDISLPQDIAKFTMFIRYLYAKVSEKESIPLEDLYTLIDSSILKQRNIGVFPPSALFSIRDSLDRLVSFVVNRPISDVDLKKTLSKINKYIRRDSVFISLNWDSLLEKTLSYAGKEIDYVIGLEGKLAKRGNREIPTTVLKPHGSLDWKICSICETIYSIAETEITECFSCKGRGSIDKKTKDDLQDLGIRTEGGALRPLIISPTFLKTNSVSQINLIYQRIFKELSEAQELLFIGYSLPLSDHDIRNILIKAYAVNGNISVRVILKEKGDESKRHEMMKRYSSIYGSQNLKFIWSGY